jgi:hypothetical protein
MWLKFLFFGILIFVIFAVCLPVIQCCQIHTFSREFTWIHTFSHFFTWFHVISREFTKKIHTFSREFTWIHVKKCEFFKCEFFHTSIKCEFFHVNSREFTWKSVNLAALYKDSPSRLLVMQNFLLRLRPLCDDRK